jgi:hypothetical protein
MSDTLANTISTIREETLAAHYDAAFTELKELVKQSPMQTVFHVYQGCVSKDVATEIAHRFSVGNGYKAAVCTSFLGRNVYLEVTMPLPAHLIHAEVVETKVVEETKTEELKIELH